MGNKICSMGSDSCLSRIPNINSFGKNKKESTSVFSSDESTKSSPAVPSTSVINQSEASVRKKLQLQISAKRARPSLQINIPGSPSVRSDGDNKHETFIRFNELVNALEDLREIPPNVRTALETSNKASASDDGGVSMLATLVRAYSHGGPATKYAIGEALAELVGSGRLNPPENATDSGYICKTMLQKARQMDPVLDLLMSHLVEQDGDVCPANSPLPRKLKEAHSVEYMRLCTRSSRRPEISMPATRAVIDKLKSEQPFADMHVFQAQHGFDSNETQMRGLFELGVKPTQLWHFPKTGARPLVLARLRHMGVSVYDNPYNLNSSRNTGTKPLTAFLDKAFDLTGDIEQHIAQLQQYAKGSADHPKPRVLLVDEGFKIGQVLVDLQQSDDPQIREKYFLISNLCPMVAHTEGDIIKGKKSLTRAENDAAKQGRTAPILPRTINMAQSTAKKLEGFAIGHSVWMDTNQLLDMMKEPEAIAQRPKETLLIGYGAIAAKAKPQLQAGHDVWIWDIDPKALLRAYEDHEKQPGSGTGKVHIPVDRATLERVVARGGARDDKEFVNALAASKKEWFGHGHIVMGNTGAPTGCLGSDDFELLPDGAILSSGASGDYEFGKTSARENNPHLAHIPATDGYVDFPLTGSSSDSKKVRVAFGDQAYFDNQVYETRSETAGTKRFMVLRGGSVANRLYGIPLPFVDITMAILIQSMYDAIQSHEDSRPDAGLWLVDPDPDAENQIINTVKQNIVTSNLGTLEEPNFANAGPHWHRPALPPSPHPSEPSEADSYTSERFVQSGIAACHAYNISPSSFALICDPNGKLTGSQDLDWLTLQREMFPTHETSSKGSIETALEIARPQRTIAHTLYALFACAATEPNDGVEAEVNAVRTRLDINDAQWTTLLETRDAYGMVPSDYGVLPSVKSAEESDNIQKGRASMQQCISIITVKAPTQEQLRGDHERREKIMSSLRTHEA